MVKLPTTIQQDEALQFAREEVARWRDMKNPWGEDSVLSPEASQAMLRHILKEAALQHPSLMLMVIDAARNGDDDADAVLKNLIIEHQSRDDRMPTALTAWNMEVLHRSLHKPPARKKKNYILRDLFISLTVVDLVDRFGLKATGRSARRRSACSIVGEALGEARMRMTDKAVEAIWERYKHVMPGWTGPVWTPG
jgi:hypothetical protein